MKKSYLILAAAATMFAACSQDTLIDESVELAQGGERAITFGTFAGKLVKGAENSENSNAELKQGLNNYHPSFQVWGYKNIATSERGKYSNVSVFDGEEVKYVETVIEPLNNWYYSPVRYWDKTATSYEFHAAAPMDALTWTETVESTGITTGEGKGNFTKTGFVINGESLPLANATKSETETQTVTEQPNDVFGKGITTKDVDLMIATDVVKQNAEFSNDNILLDFNHILSRFNIGVKIGNGIKVKYYQKKVTYDETPVGLYKDGSNNYYVKQEGEGENAGTYFAKQVEVDDENEATVIPDVDPVAWNDATYTPVDNTNEPKEGVVLLKELKVYNLYSTGNFDESKASGATLSGGTALRWLDGTTSPSIHQTYGFPNTEVTGAEDGDEDNALNLSKDFEVSTTEFTKEDFKLVYQGLQIPQVVKYEDLKIDGSNLNMSTAAPYVKIVYTIDEQDYTAYYNLASVFTTSEVAQEAHKTEAGNKVCENIFGTTTTRIYFDGNNYLRYDAAKNDTDNPALANVYYKKGDQYFNSSSTPVFMGDDNNLYETEAKAEAKENGTALNVDAIIEKDASDNVIYLPKYKFGECDITFCEGWQNNLWITISPMLIKFEANVYEWDTYKEGPIIVY